MEIIVSIEKYVRNHVLYFVDRRTKNDSQVWGIQFACSHGTLPLHFSWISPLEAIYPGEHSSIRAYSIDHIYNNYWKALSLVCACTRSRYPLFFSYSWGGECHSSWKGSAASTGWYIDYSSSAALYHPRQHQSGHQSGSCDVFVHQVQQALLRYFNQVERGSQGLIHTVYQEANIFTPYGFFDGLACCLVQGEVGENNNSFDSIALGEGCSCVSNRSELLSDKDNADTVSGQLLCIGCGHRLWCTWQERGQ